jgi:two-component system sensor histidine kinase YesM
MGFAAVTVPLVILLIWNNIYATKVVHSQVAQSNKNLLTLYTNQVDQVLDDIEKYLFKTASQDNDLITLSAYDESSPDTYFARYHTLNGLYVNSNYYKNADVLFAYSVRHKQLLIAPQTDLNYQRKTSINDRLNQLLLHRQNDSNLFKSWILVFQDDQYSLVRVVDTGYNSFIGAWVDINRLMVPLNLLHLGNNGQALFLSKDGDPLMLLADADMSKSLSKVNWKENFDTGGNPYKIINLKEKYLLVAEPSHISDILLAVMIPEKNLLEGLAFFQKINLYVPALALVILMIYLVFLQRYILKPISKLIRGMRRIYSGDLSARFNDDKLVEFMMIGETFNNMVTQIEVLKIDIYEEQIRTQKAELKHLQAQIHPHFFMNSLNIVYNLAQTRDYELIQQMAISLVKYFRFAIRTHLSSITLEEELEHIHNYLSVQKVRYPENLSYEIEIDAELKGCRIPPSTIFPLVENAMIHGFTVHQEEQFIIQISVRQDQLSASFIDVEVRDNGRGISTEQLEKLHANGYLNEQGNDHVGLWNVMRRCKLYYKTGIEIRIDNGEARGAYVTLRLPRNDADE